MGLRGVPSEVPVRATRLDVESGVQLSCIVRRLRITEEHRDTALGIDLQGDEVGDACLRHHDVMIGVAVLVYCPRSSQARLMQAAPDCSLASLTGRPLLLHANYD